MWTTTTAAAAAPTASLCSGTRHRLCSRLGRLVLLHLMLWFATKRRRLCLRSVVGALSNATLLGLRIGCLVGNPLSVLLRLRSPRLRGSSRRRLSISSRPFLLGTTSRWLRRGYFCLGVFGRLGNHELISASSIVYHITSWRKLRRIHIHPGCEFLEISNTGQR